MHIPKPFKNPLYTKNATRRTQTLKTLLSREKERDKAVRAERSEKLKGTGTGAGGEAATSANETGTNDAEMRDDSKPVDDAEKMDIDIGEINAAFRKDELELIEEEGINPDDIPSCEHLHVI